MRRDPTEFRKRFAAWKDGKKPYDGGRIAEVVITPDLEYNLFLNTLPDNQRLTPEENYTTHRYWELNDKPKNFSLAIQKGMYTMEPDGWHANTVLENKKTGEIEFMKPWNHSSIGYEYNWYRSSDPEAVEFRKQYKHVPSAPNAKYVPRFKDGKLPRYGDGTKPVNVGEYKVYPSAIGASELNVTTPEVVVTGTDRRPLYLRYDAPNSSYNTDDIVKGFNALTLGGMNNLSPTQWARRFYDAPKLFSGDMSFSDYTNRWLNGNEGIVSREFAKNHPYYSAAINMAGDVGGLLLLKSLPSTLRFIDRGFVPKQNILSLTDNTMTRYIGTGDSGYKDALMSDVIRGNINPPRFTAANLAKMRRLFKESLSEEDFRDLASNNIKSEELFNRINNILSKSSTSRKIGRFDFGKDYSLGDSWEDYLQENIRNLNLVLQQAYILSFSKAKEVSEWIKNWRVSTDPNVAKGHPLPTFALSKEVLTNSRLFPGDYAVQIKNADKYARTAEAFGHFKEHPTTYRPMSPFEKDVTMFKRLDGLLTGHKYMIKVPKSQMAKDKSTYLTDLSYSANPIIRRGLGINYDLLNLEFPMLLDLQKLQILPFVQNIQTMKSE